MVASQAHPVIQVRLWSNLPLGTFLPREVPDLKLWIRALYQAECVLVRGPVFPAEASVPWLHLADPGLLDKLFQVG